MNPVVSIRDGLSRLSLFAAIVLCMTLLAPMTGWSQTGANDQDALEQEYEEAFQELFRDPGNLEKTFKFAELAVKVGNYETAISALERMLLVNPNLPRVRLELGVLYFRLGSYQISKTYLTRALEGPNVPDSVRERVEVFLAEIDKRLTPHGWSGSIYAGLRLQMNANAGPSTPAVKANGADATLSDEFLAKRDENIFFSGNLKHTYDFQTQNGAILETDYTGYISQQHREKTLDLGLISIETGPRFTTSPGFLTDSTYRPYAAFSVVGLEHARYLTTYGLGIEGTKTINDKLAANAVLERKKKRYRTSNSRPTADLQNGSVTRLQMGLRYARSQTDLVSVTGQYASTDALEEFHSNEEMQATLAYTKQHNSPEWIPYPIVKQSPWTTTLSGARVVSTYGGPNDAVLPGSTRRDGEWRWGLITTIPVSKDWSLIANVQRIIVDSNISNFEYVNEIFSVGAAWRF